MTARNRNPNEDRDITPTEAAFLLGYLMGRGRSFTTAEVQEIMQTTTIRSAYAAMYRYSRSTPLINDSGVWRVIDRTPRKKKEGE